MLPFFHVINLTVQFFKIQGPSCCPEKNYNMEKIYQTKTDEKKDNADIQDVKKPTKKIDWCEKDKLYAQRVLEIEKISDNDQRAERLLFYACDYAWERKEELFVDILERFQPDKEILAQQAVEFRGFLVHYIKKKKKKNES
ncbi:hypothetical protein RFI_08960 [Reticulomyxa filosa]|uniref:Uncharacterized protein n=1 Tax=Reticulomyxa filosa TaxID=46433 RepID=X6NS53_RETFI|nr:hypothetical protein RFI_08960 [Reticulomyxa filosa]|eukprot:ETO28172.1 hypothetical protein RFI_08960 [Reticulomyxa filosa]